MLTDLAVKAATPAKKAYKLPAENNLVLWVLPTGSKVWRFHYRFQGKEKTLTLGKFPDLGLKDARLARNAARGILSGGVDPSQARKDKRETDRKALLSTVENVTRAWSAAHFAKETKHCRKVLMGFVRDVFPFIGKKPIAATTKDDIEACLQRVSHRGAQTRARYTGDRLGQVFKWAIDQGLCASNPANLAKLAFKKPDTKNFKAVTKPERLAEILRTIDGSSPLKMRWMLQLLALTFVRPGELAAARWEDISFDDKQWLNHVSKTAKSGVFEVIVPLSRQAVEILNLLKNLSGHTPWVFPNTANTTRHMCRGSINLALGRLGIDDQCAHGFRASARSLIDERLEIRYDFIEMQLGHSLKMPNGTAYARAQYLAGRTAMMQRWADYLDELKAGQCLKIKKTA